MFDLATLIRMSILQNFEENPFKFLILCQLNIHFGLVQADEKQIIHPLDIHQDLRQKGNGSDLWRNQGRSFTLS